MMQERGSPNEVRAFWNSRAGLGQWAGSRDVIAKQLEIMAISSRVRDGMRILEIGCGNGITAIELARRFDVKVTGIDYAEEMIVEAKALAQGHNFRGSVTFRTGDVRQLPEFQEAFDLAFTERVLINLPDWESQRAAMMDIMRALIPGGVYLMCENSQDGLDRINELRARVDLTKIDPPWHNRYLRDSEIAQLRIPDVTLEAIDYYSSTYYFLSRVVNAALAKQNDQEPDYDSQVNQLALRLPSIGELGQGRIWLWRKN
jgi:ubiquinone/menaquinone biosynthesis C-methylase UbiE